MLSAVLDASFAIGKCATIDLAAMSNSAGFGMPFLLIILIKLNNIKMKFE